METSSSWGKMERMDSVEVAWCAKPWEAWPARKGWSLVLFVSLAVPSTNMAWMSYPWHTKPARRQRSQLGRVSSAKSLI